jgi:HD-like signal output (HDOD) protein
MLTKPLPDLNAWSAHFMNAPIPVLAGTVEELHTLQAVNDASDSVDARMISEAVFDDPLMILRILATAARMRRPSQVTDVETVTAAVLLMGLTRFFREFSTLDTVNQALSESPLALNGLQRVIRRARRAAHFAQAIAVHRMDEDIAVVCEAALLHDFAEMLLWCHAPNLALDIAQRQTNDPTLRSVDAQRDVLGIELQELEQTLMTAWRLPELLIRITTGGSRYRVDDAQVATVDLAIRIARHSQDRWDNPALPDDYTALGGLLNMLPSAAQAMIEGLGV